MSVVQGAIWLIGIGVLALTDWWWPGILFLVAASTLLSGVFVQALPAPATPHLTPPDVAIPRMGQQAAAPAPPVMSAVGVSRDPAPAEVKLPARCPHCGGPTGTGVANSLSTDPHVCHYCGSRLI